MNQYKTNTITITREMILDAESHPDFEGYKTPCEAPAMSLKQVQICYDWFDKVTKTEHVTKERWPIKHIIEKDAQEYISTGSARVAAFLHPDIKGTYPHFNIANLQELWSESCDRNFRFYK